MLNVACCRVAHEFDMEGWIKLYRRIIESLDYFSEPFTRTQAWVDLILMANYRVGYIRIKGVRVKVEPGEVITSTVALSNRWRWSRGKVLRFLNELEVEQQIAQVRTSVYTSISIINYSKYQADGTGDDIDDDTTDGTSSDTSEEEYKKDKNINTHTVDTVKGVVGGNGSSEAEALIGWIEAHYPALARKQRPLTIQQAEWLLKKHPVETLRRIIAEMADNPKTSEKEDVYCRMVTFLRWDRQEKTSEPAKYTYEEVCDAVTLRGQKWEHFSPIKGPQGKVLYWVKKETRIS